MIDFNEGMNDDHGFSLRSTEGGTQAVLAGVQAQGRLEGVLFSITLRQTYRNAGSTPLAGVHTFPLPSRSVLLGFAAVGDGKRLEARILPRRDASQTGDEPLAGGDALARDDAPVMLEAGADGLHRARIARLQAGEQVVLEVRTAQLLSFEQGRLRPEIPRTIAPRHGDPLRAGRLPHQVPEAVLAAACPLSIELAVMGSLASGDIGCTTHAYRRTAIEGGTLLALAPGATLDRDVVFLVTPSTPRPGLPVQGAEAVDARAGSGVVARAAFSWPTGSAQDWAPLKQRVACRGSMAADGMRQALGPWHGRSTACATSTR